MEISIAISFPPEIWIQTTVANFPACSFCDISSRAMFRWLVQQSESISEGEVSSIFVLSLNGVVGKFLIFILGNLCNRLNLRSFSVRMNMWCTPRGTWQWNYDWMKNWKQRKLQTMKISSQNSEQNCQLHSASPVC